MRRTASRTLVVVIGLLAALTVAGCSGLVEREPSPTPQDFGGIVSAFGAAGIVVRNPQSADAGCSDPNLIPTAIGFDATGLGVTMFFAIVPGPGSIFSWPSNASLAPSNWLLPSDFVKSTR